MKHTVLIVDDEEGMRTLLELMLKREDFCVIKSDNAFEALDYIEAQVPDLVITDLMMPGMTGIELIKELRSKPETSKTPIFVLTARKDNATRLESENVGANQFLTKPIKRDALLSCVHAAL